MTITRASWMFAVALSTSPVITAGAAPDLDGAFLGAGLRVMNITPEFVVLVKVAPSKPAMMTVLVDAVDLARLLGRPPGSPHRWCDRATSAGRQLHDADQVALVLVGNEAGGRRLHEVDRGRR